MTTHTKEIANYKLDYRVIVTQEEGLNVYSVHVVFFDEKDNPVKYIQASPVMPVVDHPEQLETHAKWLLEAATKPFLWGGDRFPQKYTKEEYLKDEKLKKESK